MTAEISRAGLELFDGLNIEYEKAYHNNPYKTSCIEKAIKLLSPGSLVLDVGCGTGRPVSEMLSNADMSVVGCDISPKMINLARARVKGTFIVADMLEFQPENSNEAFAAVFIIFSHLQLDYASFHRLAYKYAQLLQPRGLFVIGQMPTDKYVKDEDHDETRTYAEDYSGPFMGDMIPSFSLSEQGQLNFLTSMGLKIIDNQVDIFQPDNEKCLPEVQQYIIAQRPNNDQPILQPKPMPKS